MIGLAGCTAARGPHAMREGQRSAGLNLYRGLSAADARAARVTMQVALETLLSRQSKSWSSGDGAKRGAVTPIRTYKTVKNLYCREYVEIVETRRFGRKKARRIACRDKDSRWKQVRR